MAATKKSGVKQQPHVLASGSPALHTSVLAVVSVAELSGEDEAVSIDLGHGVFLPIPPESKKWLDQWNGDMLNSLAASSQRVLHSVLRGYTIWSAEMGQLAPLPTPFDGAVSYCEHLMARGLKRSTLEAHVWGLSMIHDATQLPNPFRSSRWKNRWRGIVRDKRIEAKKKSKKGLTFALLLRMLDTIDSDLRGLRDVALLRLAYDSLARRAELSALCWSDIERLEDGAGMMFIGRSKTDQQGEGMSRYLRPDTITALDRWAQAAASAGSDTDSGPVFRPVPRAIKQQPSDRALTGRAIAEIVKARLRGLGPQIDVADYAAHSTRIGATEDLFASGARLGQIMLAGGWKSPAQPVQYARKHNVRTGAMAALARIQARQP